MHLIRPPPRKVERTYVTQGLVGQDDNVDMLEGYFKEMQKTTVETAQPDDFLSFACCAHFFGVIILETTTIPVDEELVESDEEDAIPPQITPRTPERRSEETEDSVYPASSRATVSKLLFQPCILKLIMLWSDTPRIDCVQRSKLSHYTPWGT